MELMGRRAGLKCEQLHWKRKKAGLNKRRAGQMQAQAVEVGVWW